VMCAGKKKKPWKCKKGGRESGLGHSAKRGNGRSPINHSRKIRKRAEKEEGLESAKSGGKKEVKAMSEARQRKRQ